MGKKSRFFLQVLSDEKLVCKIHDEMHLINVKRYLIYFPLPIFQSLDSVCNPIINKPKPKVEPPKEEKKENKEGKEEAAPGEKPASNSTESEAKPENKQEMEVD